MKRAWRWIWRGALGLIALAVVGLVAVLIALHTDWGREQIRVRAERALAEAVRGAAHIERVEGSVLGTVVVRGVELTDHEGRRIARAETVRVELALLPLLRGTAHVESLLVDGVVASIHATKTPRPEPPIEEPSGWTVELPAVVVRDARIEIEATDEPITLEGVEVAAAGVIAPHDGPILANVHVRGTWKERAAPITMSAGVRVADTISLPYAFADVGGVSVTAAGVDLERLVGHVFARGSADQIARLAPGVELPGEVVLALDAVPAGAASRVVVRGRVGTSRVDGVVVGSVDLRTASGVIAATDVELASITEQKVRGRGTAVVAFAADGEPSGPRARGAVIATGAVQGAPRGAVVAGFDATAHGANVFAVGAGEGDTRFAAIGALARDGDRIELVHGLVGASTQNPEVASAGRAPVHGVVEVTASGRGPIDAITIDGRIAAKGVQYNELGAARVHGTFRATLAATPSARAHLVATALTHAGELLGRGSVDVRTLDGGRIAVTARGHAAAAPVSVDADAVISPGEVIDIALGRHRVQTETSTWTGRGGTVRVDDRRITIRDLASGSGGGKVAIEATIGRTVSSLAATVDARDVPASALDPTLAGTLTGALAVERHGGRWRGGGTVTATDLVLEPGARPLGGDVSIVLDGRRVSLSATARTAELGGARVALEVDGPRDPLDLGAWRRVARADLHAIVIGFDALRPQLLADVPGVYDGTLEIRDGTPSGVLHVRDVPTEVGPASAELSLALTDPGFVDVHATASTDALGGATLEARLQIPERPFDPAAWQRLGRHVIAGATARTSEISIDPTLLARLGVRAEYRARATVDVVVGAGAESADVHVEVRDLRGGVLARGIDIDVTAQTDSDGTIAGVRASSGALTLVETRDLRTPVTLAQWLDAPRAALAAPLAGTLAIPSQPVADTLAIVGRRLVERGTLAGTMSVGGTLARPTGTAIVELRDLTVTPGLTRRKPPALEQLRVSASWDGSRGTLDVSGKEAGKGTLAISAQGRPDALAGVAATVTIDDFEIAPITVFLPGVLAGASGQIDANLGIRGLDPATAHVRGTLAIADARMPLTPVIGTLRDANATIEITDRGVSAKLDGKIGGGKIVARATAGADARETTLSATLTEIAPIGVLQPKITTNIQGTLRRTGLRFTGELDATNTVVRVPPEDGVALLDPDLPEDLYFVDLPIPQGPKGAQPPARPWLVVDVNLAPARIEAPRYAVVSSLIATAEGRVRVSFGETIGMDGRIELERASADVFGHRYRLDEGEVVFDGTPDARFDLAMSTDLRDMTMLVRLAGRVSELDRLQPQLSSEPAIYSQGQLIGFFLGGTPTGDPSEQTRDAVVGAGSSIASQRVARFIERGLSFVPLELPVPNCVPRLSDNAVVCTVGKWVTRDIFVWYDYQSERQLGDNTGAGKLEWHFRPRWTLETAADFDYVGADLTWRKRW